MKTNFCGIDFGTTNSAVSVLNQDNTSKLIQFEEKETIPTAIFFPEEGREIIYGSAAIEKYISGVSGRFMRSIKRILGTDLMDVKTEVNKKLLSYDDIIYYFFRHLKQTAEEQYGNLENVVLGRPVHFQDFAPEADEKAEAILRKIAKRVGFKNINFLYEPLAAAYAHERRLQKETLACVVDMGGGTSDFSIIRLGNKGVESNRLSDILANGGLRIGGNDFDYNLSLKCYMPRFGYGTQLKADKYNNKILPVPLTPYVMLSELSSINNLYTYKEQKNVEQIYNNAAESEKVAFLYEVVQKELGHTLLNNVEQTKIALTQNEQVNTTLDFLSRKPKFEIKVSDFESSIIQNVEKVKNAMIECLVNAGVSSDKIGLVILTGGTTSIPYVRKVFTEFFPKAEISEDDKLSSVSSGLLYEAYRIYR